MILKITGCTVRDLEKLCGDGVEITDVGKEVRHLVRVGFKYAEQVPPNAAALNDLDFLRHQQEHLR